VRLILGKTGRNFAAGMSGGLAWVYNPDNSFAENCNTEMVDLDPLSLRMKSRYLPYCVNTCSLTGSKVAQGLLANWNEVSTQFVKVYPKEYKKVIRRNQNIKLSAK
jgi:glutamate synthase (NADPH/NADH) large chain